MPDGEAATPTTPDPETEGAHDISLLLGGPFFQLLLRIGFIRPTFDLLFRRMVVLSLLPWLPLLVLTLVAGTAYGHAVALPFLRDVEVHARFLVAVPLLVLAERMTHQRLRPVFDRFVERGLVAPKDLPRFEEILSIARRRRNSYLAEAIMLVVSFALTPLVWAPHIVLAVPTWYGQTTDGGLELAPAGWWYAYFAIPLMRFLLLRWLYRIAILYGVLARMSKLPLRYVPTHPDKVGGLAFLGEMGISLQPFHMAITAIVSGYVAGQILFGGQRLDDFYVLIGCILAFLLILTLLPLVFFSAPLALARRRGLAQYGELSQRYVESFRAKWVDPVPKDGTEILGSADIQSLADLSTAYDIVREMQTIPVSLRQAVRLLVVAAVPLLPLLLTKFSLETILERASKMIL